MRSMRERLFYCPAKGYISGYRLAFRSDPPGAAPKCEDCGQAFPPTLDGKWLHYRTACSILRITPADRDVPA
jgi:hypothetical protein